MESVMAHEKLYNLMARHVNRRVSGNDRDMTLDELKQLKAVIDSHYFLKLRERNDEYEQQAAQSQAGNKARIVSDL